MTKHTYLVLAWSTLDSVTFVGNCHPGVKVSLVGQGVEVTALYVSEAGQLTSTRRGVTDPIPPPLSQTVLPSVLRTAPQDILKSIICCDWLTASNIHFYVVLEQCFPNSFFRKPFFMPTECVPTSWSVSALSRS